MRGFQLTEIRRHAVDVTMAKLEAGIPQQLRRLCPGEVGLVVATIKTFVVDYWAYPVEADGWLKHPDFRFWAGLIGLDAEAAHETIVRTRRKLQPICEREGVR